MGGTPRAQQQRTILENQKAGAAQGVNRKWTSALLPYTKV